MPSNLFQKTFLLFYESIWSWRTVCHLQQQQSMQVLFKIQDIRHNYDVRLQSPEHWLHRAMDNPAVASLIVIESVRSRWLKLAAPSISIFRSPAQEVSSCPVAKWLGGQLNVEIPKQGIITILKSTNWFRDKSLGVFAIKSSKSHQN